MQQYIPNAKAQFTYPNFAVGGIDLEGMTEYATHSGQIVTVLREDAEAFEDGDGNKCRGYIIQADDGWQGTVWPGELRPAVEHKRP